ncbi:MAG: hypothetical protein LBL92_03895 [Propionibacteriaceae bacterium]|jgi:hypothetical protein|nr:hypothetical protein [Propionibacteriaceae bacterium]
MRKTIAAGVAGIVLFAGVGVPMASADTVTGAGSALVAASSVSLSKAGAQVKWKANTVKIKVRTSLGATWTATPAVDWLKVTPATGTSGTKVTIEVAQNYVTTDDEILSREGEVLFSAGGATTTFRVRQDVPPTVISVAGGGTWNVPWGETRDFKDGYYNKRVTFTSGGTAAGFDCSTSVSDAWISVADFQNNVAAGSGSFTVLVAANYGPNRNGNLKVKCGHDTVKIKIKQADGPFVGVWPKNWIVVAEGGVTRIRVNVPEAGTSWTSEVTEGADWVSAGKTAGSKNHEWIIVNAEPNPNPGTIREGTITFTGWRDTDGDGDLEAINTADLTITQTNERAYFPYLDSNGGLTLLIQFFTALFTGWFVADANTPNL